MARGLLLSLTDSYTGSTAAYALCTIATAAISTIPAMSWCKCKVA